MVFSNIRRVYLIGIGGIGMSALARFFAHQGKEVCGYDRSESPLTKELEAEGIGVHYTDSVELIPEAFRISAEHVLVIYTPAVPKNHAELNFFQSSGYTVVKRAAALGVAAESMRTAAVAGTHGKTSTSTMLAHLLCQTAGGCDAFLGGISRNFSSNLVLQNRGEDRLVVEADEFDRSFLSLYPELAIVTSTDADHLDIYGSHAEVIDAFRAFMSQVKEGGIAILKKEVAYLAESTKARVFTYSLTEQADFTVSNLTIKDGYYHFNINTPVGIFPDIMLGIPGKYNVENALAASAAAILWGISAHELRRGLESFAGVQRRFDVRFRDEKTIFIDDYAHHPQELWAAITSVRELFPKKRITGVFQPHLFTRTRDFAEDFARSLDLLDEVVLLEIYPARELPIEGISSQTIKNLMRNQQVTICPKERLVETLHSMNPEVLITMGAGDIDRLVNPIAEMLKTRN